MEFRNAIIAASIGAGVVLAPAAFAADADRERQSVGEYVADAALTTKVKAAIMADKELSVLDISVETNEGVATLTGTVGTDTEAEHAATVAGGVKGIKEVENRLTVDPTKDKPASVPMQTAPPARGGADSGASTAPHSITGN